MQDDVTIAPCTLGRIASYYYLHHTTVKLFIEELNAESNVEHLLHVLSVGGALTQLLPVIFDTLKHLMLLVARL